MQTGQKLATYAIASRMVGLRAKFCGCGGMVDAAALGAVVLTDMGVRVPPPAPVFMIPGCFADRWPFQASSGAGSLPSPGDLEPSPARR